MGDTKRIAKNTVLLYIRMLICTIISLYTSRVVLNTLGASDFGIYSLVGGVVALFGFINTSLANAGQRFLSVAIGENKNVQTVFSSLLVTHLLVAIVIVFLAETVGLWLVYNTLSIPDDRFQAALWVYQISIIGACFNIIKVPYNSSIIANEKMGFYAYVSVIESVLKLVIVYLLVVSPFDKLVYYAFLHLGVSIFVFVLYVYYAKKVTDENKFILRRDKALFKNIFLFTGWNFFGSFGDMCTRQGVSIILNMFYGVVLNAAYGIFMTVRSTIYLFVSSIQVAANPQIIKSYAANDKNQFHRLICMISKYSFFMMLVLAIPVCINIDFVLRVWLVNPPEYTSLLVVWGMIFSLVDSLHGPLWVSMQATGNIRNYQIVTSIALVLILPVSYIALKLGAGPEWIIISQVIVGIVILFIRIRYTHVYTSMSYMTYINQVILPIVFATIICIPIAFLISRISFASEWIRLFVTSMISVLLVVMVVWFIGFNKNERKQILNILIAKISSRKQNG